MEKVVESSKFGSEVSSSCSILERKYKMNESFIFTATIHNLFIIQLSICMKEQLPGGIGDQEAKCHISERT